MLLHNIFLLTGAFIIKAVAYEKQQPNCPMKHSNEPLITRADVKLKGHQREILKSQSFPQCSLRCVQKDWCISINFEAAKRKGMCELNDYGVENEYYLLKDDRNEFEVSRAFVYSQLRPSKVSFVVWRLLWTLTYPVFYEIITEINIREDLSFSLLILSFKTILFIYLKSNKTKMKQSRLCEGKYNSLFSYLTLFYLYIFIFFLSKKQFLLDYGYKWNISCFHIHLVARRLS